MAGFLLTSLPLSGEDVVDAMHERIFPAKRAICARIIAIDRRWLHPGKLTRGKS
jgi:hypothetical protein